MRRAAHWVSIGLTVAVLAWLAVPRNHSGHEHPSSAAPVAASVRVVEKSTAQSGSATPQTATQSVARDRRLREPMAATDHPPLSRRPVLEAPLTERIRTIARPATELRQPEDGRSAIEDLHRSNADPFGDGDLSDREVHDLVSRGDDRSLETLSAALFDPETTLDTKQDVLANVEEMIEDDGTLIGLLREVIEDEQQSDEIRVQALSRLSDFGIDYVRPYHDAGNEELATEVDLIERLEAYRSQHDGR